MKGGIRKLFVASSCLAAGLAAMPAAAGGVGQVFGGVPEVSGAALDRMRGGFSEPGFNISFGIRDVTTVNGVVVATQQASLGEAAGAGAALAPLPSQWVSVASDGQINVSTIANGPWLAIQNSMNGAQIAHVTDINAVVSGARLALLKQTLAGQLNTMLARAIR